MQRLIAFMAAAALTLTPALGWAQDSGAAAFARNDLATAQALWQQEAAAGQPEAMLGLGLLADRGFGGARDPAAAYDWYAKAADLGLAEAQFNMAVIYDSGQGRPRDVSRALLWYTRAALRDHARAQYNLALIYEDGDGVTANPALAQFWFDKAATSVPAAAGKALTPLVDNGLIAPKLLFANNAEVVWTINAATAPIFLVEAILPPKSDQNYQPPLVSEIVTGTGLVSEGFANTLWRVTSLTEDRIDYAASDWIGTADVAAPLGRVTLVADPASVAMLDAASVFANDLRHAGYWVRLDQRTPQAGEAFISYAYAADQPMAANLAAYLPSLTGITPVKQRLNTTAPGEIIVNLAAFR